MFYVVEAAGAQLAPTRARAAIVTVVMGEAYEKTWERLCMASWLDYAQRFGFDLIVVKDRLDKTDARSPAWQKLLILNQPWSKRYERIVWLDSDIIVAEHAPNILEHCGPPEKVSLCAEGGRLSPAEAQIYVERTLNIPLPPDAYLTAWRQVRHFMYENNQVPTHDVSYNTGVMVLSPAHHEDLFLRAYRRPQVTNLYEQPWLSHLLIEEDWAFAINPRFNWGLVESLRMFVHAGLRGDEDESFIGQVVLLLARAELRNAFFLHFYAAMPVLHHFASSPVFDEAPVSAAA